MPILSDLPTEILRQIFSYLPCVDLINSCLVSHRFCSIASRFLYTNVIVSASTIHLFARTILACPELGSYITTFRSTWALGGSREAQAIEVSRLLRLLLNLAILDCTPPETGTQATLDIFCANRLSEEDDRDVLPAGLRSVTEIRSGNDANDEECEDSVTLTVLLAMMLLPSIRKIQAYTTGFEQPADIGALFAPYAGRSSVTHLQLFECYTSMPTLDQILQVPHALTHFSYRYVCYDISSMDCAAFGLALRHLRDTLQFLALDFSEGLRGTDEGVAAARRTIGSLRDWPMLTYVRSSLQPLLGVPNALETRRLGDVLPVAIETLVLDMDMVWETPETAAAVIDLVKRKEAYGLVRLGAVDVAQWYLPARDFCGLLREACEAAGVRFRVVGSDWETEVIYSE